MVMTVVVWWNKLCLPSNSLRENTFHLFYIWYVDVLFSFHIIHFRSIQSMLMKNNYASANHCFVYLLNLLRLGKRPPNHLVAHSSSNLMLFNMGRRYAMTFLPCVPRSKNVSNVFVLYKIIVRTHAYPSFILPNNIEIWIIFHGDIIQPFELQKTFYSVIFAVKCICTRACINIRRQPFFYR